MVIGEGRVPSMTPHRITKIYVSGARVDSSSQSTISVINPATEEPIAEVTDGSAQDAQRAVAAARQGGPAQPSRRLFAALIAAVAHQFHRDYGVVLGAVVFAIDRHRARRITGVTPDGFR